jgi:hypothetical protein
MDERCVAILRSSCGDWVFYDYNALQVAMTAHTMSGVGSSLVTKQHDVEVARTTLGCSSPAGGPNTSSDKLDGFTLAEWAAFARKKASIASSVAKLNGELKSKLASASSRDGWFCNDPWADSAKTRDGELNAQMASSVDTYPERSGDLLNKFDPWAGATFHGTKAKESPTDGADAWSQWIPGAFSEKSKGKFDVMGKSANNKSVLTDDFKDDCKGLPLSELPHKVTSWNDAMGDVGDDHSVEYHVAPITGDAVPKDFLNDIKGKKVNKDEHPFAVGDWRRLPSDGWVKLHRAFDGRTELNTPPVFPEHDDFQVFNSFYEHAQYTCYLLDGGDSDLSSLAATLPRISKLLMSIFNLSHTKYDDDGEDSWMESRYGFSKYDDLGGLHSEPELSDSECEEQGGRARP